MIAKLFLALTDYPIFRRLIWKPIYEWLAGRFNIYQWEFMNYGYVPSGHESTIRLEERDEINRYPIQLYHYLASKINLQGLDLLEVGSGRGGGCNYVKKYLKPHRVIGLDIARNAVKLSQKTYKQNGLYFQQGNAEQLPFEDCYFDVVLNVESCHAYGSVPKFLSEVSRVLCKGGYFLCTDMRSPEGMDRLREYLQNSGMEMLEEEVISNNVVEAIEQEEEIKLRRIESDIPGWFKNTFREFAGVKGSKIHTDLKNGTLIYHRFVLRKHIQ